MFGIQECTIHWYVDNLKINCQSNNKVVESLINKLNTHHYGKIAPLAIIQGRVLNYLKMRIDYIEKGKVIFTMYDYVNEILESLPVDMKEVSAIPTWSRLFKVDNTNTTEMLDEAPVDLFRHYTAQLLFHLQTR